MCSFSSGATERRFADQENLNSGQHDYRHIILETNHLGNLPKMHLLIQKTQSETWHSLILKLLHDYCNAACLHSVALRVERLEGMQYWRLLKCEQCTTSERSTSMEQGGHVSHKGRMRVGEQLGRCFKIHMRSITAEVKFNVELEISNKIDNYLLLSEFYRILKNCRFAVLRNSIAELCFLLLTCIANPFKIIFIIM